MNRALTKHLEAYKKNVEHQKAIAKKKAEEAAKRKAAEEEAAAKRKA